MILVPKLNKPLLSVLRQQMGRPAATAARVAFERASRVVHRLTDAVRRLRFDVTDEDAFPRTGLRGSATNFLQTCRRQRKFAGGWGVGCIRRNFGVTFLDFGRYQFVRSFDRLFGRLERLCFRLPSCTNPAPALG